MDAAQTDRELILYMIGNAHIDPVWLWPLSEGRAEVLSTYRTAIALIHEFDGYVFTSGGAVTYEWVREDDPELFAAIQAEVQAGTWCLVNGWWLQPDCNVPGGESFVRHALYGQRYLQRWFGQRARVGYNVDSFGHAATLPQLLKLGGLDYYVFFRPGPHEKDLPAGPFWWEAPGGVRVLACRPPLHYPTSPDVDMHERMLAAAAEVPPQLPLSMCFYGVGNHGGGPTRRNVRAICAVQQQQGALKPVFSSPDTYFAAAEALGREWPVVHDDLQHHARGCYTALSRVKRENRYAEHALMRAERLDALAATSCGTPDARAEIEQAWRGVLFNQFHDIMAGTSIRVAYDEVWQTYAQAAETCANVQERALAALETRIGVAERGRAWFVWNPLPWERTEEVAIAYPMGGWSYDSHGVRYPGQPQVTDADGNPLPCQLCAVELERNTYIAHLEVRLTVPALGVRVLYVTIPDAEPPADAPQVRHADTIANEFYRLRVDPQTGALSSLWDLERDEELLAGPAGLPLVIADDSDTWSHDVLSFREVVGTFQADGPAELVRSDSLGQTLRVCSHWGHSTMVHEYTLRPGRRDIAVTASVDWHEQFKMLKLAFPLRITQSRATASAPFGWMTRTPNGEEEPCQGWVDLSGQATTGERGLCLVNDSQYGYDTLEGELRLSVLRSPIYAFHVPRRYVPSVQYHFVDQGQQTLRYLLLPHGGDWRTVNPARRSLEWQEPLFVRPAAPQTGEWGDVSLLRVEPENVQLTTVKLAEEDGCLLARGFEAYGEPTQMVITSEAWGRRWEYTLAPHQIWTLKLPLDGTPPRSVNGLEEPLE